MNKIAAAVVALALSAPSFAWAQGTSPELPPPEAPPPTTTDERPSTGLAYLITGGVFTGLGAVNLATAPLCTTLSSLSDSGERACLDASLIVGGIFLATGIPLLVVGGIKRSAYKEWKANHPWAAGLGISTARSGGMLTWRAAF